MIEVFTDTLFELRDAMGNTTGLGLTETIRFFESQTIEIKSGHLLVTWQLHFDRPEQETVFRLKYGQYL